MARAAKKPEARSPYQKYGKTPYVYSDLYRRWKTAIKAGRKDEAEALSIEHMRRIAIDSLDAA